ncbi:hypothetical protein GGS20DRAFT_557330 [Poronia punctata]|nr:hypothetical protein GGS20DRAFT_557330 [Poronia punctata]
MTGQSAADTPTMSAPASAIPSRVVSGASTPQSLPPMDPEERTKSINVSLADMVAKATALYHSKKYEEAAEIFSTATERQAELNGEMAPENADVLFLYGRCLFKVGQSNSDVLGGKAPVEKKATNGANAKPKKSKADAPAEETTGAEQIVANAAGVGETSVPDAKKPLFQFNGDERFEDSDEEAGAEEEQQEGEGEEGGEEEEEEEDDLAVAFEILEVSRVLFEKQLEEANPEGPDKEITGEQNSIVRHIKERLSDIHDLLAEISLENEKYPEAIKDCRATLKYKQELYANDSEIIAEAHFKLSLALEFASMTSTDDDGTAQGPKNVDENMRKEAADELEKAINCTKLKLEKKELDLATVHAPEENEETRKQITEVKEIIADMEQRLIELRKPPVDMKEALGQDNPLTGLLGKAFGETATKQAARVEEAKKNARDLSGFVRKKAKADLKPDSEATDGKRKAEEPAEGHADTKKTKVDESTTES